MLNKVDLLMLEILANCNWERPLYLAISVGSVSKLKFDNYFCAGRISIPLYAF